MNVSDEENLQHLYATTGGLPYNPPSYTCIKDFTDSFPKTVVPEFAASPNLPEPLWLPEAPYPRIYTKNYKKSILTVYRQG